MPSHPLPNKDQSAVRLCARLGRPDRPIQLYCFRDKHYIVRTIGRIRFGQSTGDRSVVVGTDPAVAPDEQVRASRGS